MRPAGTPIWRSNSPRRPAMPLGWMIALACLCIATWQGVEWQIARWPHPRADQLRAAAAVAKAAQEEIARTKATRQLLQPETLDPNRTGLIGPDWSETTTTLGDAQAKRTATNPDLAAAIARILVGLELRPGARIAIIASGSFPGANIAAISAVEILGLTPVIIASLGSSMFGANDPDFGWLDMEAAVRRAGIWQARTSVVVLGGEGANGGGLPATGRDRLIEAARRNGFEPILAQDLSDLKRRVMTMIDASAPEGLVALINIGGAVLGIGTCLDAYALPSGLITRKLACDRGISGLVQDIAAHDRPVLHLLNIKRLALDWGLPHDPIPLPAIGENRGIYGRLPLSPDIH